MIKALEQIRRMRGGAQSHLMRCSDGNYYVVKFQNNPQHRRILVNELLGTRLASRLGLPTAPVEVVEVGAELIRLTPELCIELPRSRTPCAAGLQFGSRYPGDPRRLTLHDFLPDEKLREVENVHDFAGMLVFDKWACNTNGRQTVFFEEASRTGGAAPETAALERAAPTAVTTGTADSGLATREVARGTLPQGKTAHAEGARPYKTVMIDQGFCFNAGEWNFPDAPLRGLYARSRVYEGVTGMDSFGPWLERLEKRITEKVLAELAEEIPPAWYEDDYDAVLRLLEQLHRRKPRVEELILSAKNSNRQPFVSWR
ncbi:MAG TPA: HipA family kinase [Candidatus Acidoferrum sp.]|nr:HipA family kinase [Candidatus Acidoferrum sp.]